MEKKTIVFTILFFCSWELNESASISVYYDSAAEESFMFRSNSEIYAETGEIPLFPKSFCSDEEVEGAGENEKRNEGG